MKNTKKKKETLKKHQVQEWRLNEPMKTLKYLYDLTILYLQFTFNSLVFIKISLVYKLIYLNKLIAFFRILFLVILFLIS